MDTWYLRQWNQAFRVNCSRRYPFQLSPQHLQLIIPEPLCNFSHFKKGRKKIRQRVSKLGHRPIQGKTREEEDDQKAPEKYVRRAIINRRRKPTEWTKQRKVRRTWYQGRSLAFYGWRNRHRHQSNNTWWFLIIGKSKDCGWWYDFSKWRIGV